MPHILKNDTLEIHIDSPDENYNYSRFDWTGKITSIKYKNIHMSSSENIDIENDSSLGKGLYNEFGISTALGFMETPIGGWFHKIGVGLLKKNNQDYSFSNEYPVKPAKFNVFKEENKITIHCISEKENGYSYLLTKVIEINSKSLIISYNLENNGDKEIITDEYTHNFIALDKASIGKNYNLKFPFTLHPKHFIETVNPENKVEIKENGIAFNNSPKEPFFFSNLSGRNSVPASWELINLDKKIGIRETGNFKTNKINLWGCKHVISPELFFNISIAPGKSMEWSRTYEAFNK